MKSYPGCIVFLIVLIVTAIAMPAFSDYCSATGGDIYEYIYRVVVGDIDNITGQTGYGDYTNLSTTMEPGVDYEITVTNGNAYYEDECGIWVDWNQDEDFNDVDEQITDINNSPGLGPYSATITPPTNAMAGETRMRIRIIYDAPGLPDEVPLPCGITTYGEVEDYTIDVNVITGEINGVKFHDLNGNGICDDGEPGLQGWSIYLDLDDNGQLDDEPNTTTDETGFYEFPNLPAGDYIVAEVIPEGWTQTFPGWAGGRLFSFQIDSDNDIETIIEVNPNDGSLINSFPLPTNILFTGPQGLAVGPTSLFFTDLSYTIDTLIADIWELDAESGYIIDHDQIDIGTRHIPGGAAYMNGKVYIAKWNYDEDANFVEIMVFDPALDTVVDTITVNDVVGDGLAAAPDLNALFATKYPFQIVKIDPSDGSILDVLEPNDIYPSTGLAYLDGKLFMGCMAAGGYPPRAYCIDPETGQVLYTLELPEFGTWHPGLGADGLPAQKYDVRIEGGQTVTVDFGNVQTNSGKIQGSKFNDIDHDGTKDTNEPPLEGWTIYLDNNNSGEFDAGEPNTITDSNGSYLFENLSPGFYHIGEVNQCHWEQTSPLLASKLLIDVNLPRDLVFDRQRNILYISTANGTIERYDLNTETLLTAYDVGTSLRGMDITPDCSALYVTEEEVNETTNQGYVHKVNLDDGSVTDIPFDLSPGGEYSFDVKIGCCGKALVTPYWYSPLRELDLATDTITVRGDIPNVGAETRIIRTPDYKYLLFSYSLLYDAGSDTFSDTDFDFGLDPFAVSRNISLYAHKLLDPILWETGSLWIYKSSQNPIMAYDYGRGGLLFDPVRNILYVLCSSGDKQFYNSIIAIDTFDLTEITGSSIAYLPEYTTFQNGMMAASPDGRYIAWTTAVGVQVFKNFHRVQTLPGRTIGDMDFGNRLCMAGDIDKDGDVDYGDILLFSDQWLQTGVLCADFEPIPDGDGSVDFRDFSVIANNWLADESTIVYDESFETGDFSAFAWSTSGDELWTVSTDYAFDGTFSAKSPSFTSDEESILEVTLNVKEGTISYLTYITAQYARIYFYIDDEMVDAIYNRKDWGQRSWPLVSEGTHTFKWVYTSDRAGNAYMDAIRFPPLAE